MNPIVEFLKKQKINVSSELIEALKIFKIRELKKGVFFHQENYVCQKIGFLISGKIRHYYNIDGKEHTRWISFKNNFVTSFTSFVCQEPSKENLECMETCKLLVLNRAEFLQLKSDFPEIVQLWTSTIENEMIGYEQRVFQLISNDAQKRYLDFSKKHPEFINEIPQKYLASMLGIEPRHLSRIRKNVLKI